MVLMTSLTLSQFTCENKDTYKQRTTLTQHLWCSVSVNSYNKAERQLLFGKLMTISTIHFNFSVVLFFIQCDQLQLGKGMDIFSSSSQTEKEIQSKI